MAWPNGELNNEYSKETQMKLKTILTGVLLVLVCTGALFAQSKENIAVLTFTGGDPREGDTIANLFTNNYSGLRDRFGIIPRTNITNALSKEQSFQNTSGMTDADTIARLGEQLGAKYVMAGSITKIGEVKILVVTIIKIETIQQIAGDYVTYNEASELRAKVPAMVKNLLSLVEVDQGNLPKLAVVPVMLEEGTDEKESNADAYAQILSISLLRIGSYAIFPRTSSLEQVQQEYKTQLSGVTSEKQAARLGYGINPEFVLSVVAGKLGSMNLFNASVLNLESGIEETSTSEEYSSLEDGMNAMTIIAQTISGQELSGRDAAARQKELAAQEKAKRDAEAKAALNEKLDPFMKNSGIVLGAYGGLGMALQATDTASNTKANGAFGPEIGFFYKWFSINTGAQFNLGYHYSERTTDKNKTKLEATYSFVQIPILARFDLSLSGSSANMGLALFGGIHINANSFSEKDNVAVTVPSLGFTAGLGPSVKMSNILLYLALRFNVDFSETAVVLGNGTPGEFTRKTMDIVAGLRGNIPFRR
jgi:TolB-like protein